VHSAFAGGIAAQRIAELHQQAARQRVLRWLRVVDAASPVNGGVRVGWVRVSLRSTHSGIGGAILR
jgi:hypothetical protein